MLLLTAMVGIGIIIFRFSSGITGNDYFWHVKTGEWIVMHHTVPTRDVFSWLGTQKGLEWIPHEWLSEVILYLTYRAAGHVGVYVLMLTLALVFYGLLLWRAGKYMRVNYAVSMLLMLFLSIVMSSFFYPRPHVFSFFLLYAELALLYRYVSMPDTRSIYLLPLIAALWSNLHGGYAVLSYVLCFVVLFSGMVPFASRWFELPAFTKRQKVRLGAVGVLCIAAVMVNPLGYKALLYPFMNQSDQLMIGAIVEWQSPDAKELVQLVLFFLPMFLVLFGYITTPKKSSVDFLLFSLFAFLFLRSVRFIFLWFVFMPFGGLRYLPQTRMKELRNIWEKVVVSIVLIGACTAIGIASLNCASLCRDGDVIATEMSDEMTEFIEKDAPEHLFNDYDYGGELIFHDIPVFFDSRADLFAADSIMRDGLTLMYFSPLSEGSEPIQPTAVLEKYPFDRILIQKNRALYSYLLTAPHRYKLLMEDDDSAYFSIE